MIGDQQRGPVRRRLADGHDAYAEDPARKATKMAIEGLPQTTNSGRKKLQHATDQNRRTDERNDRDQPKQDHDRRDTCAS